MWKEHYPEAGNVEIWSDMVRASTSQSDEIPWMIEIYGSHSVMVLVRRWSGPGKHVPLPQIVFLPKARDGDGHHKVPEIRDRLHQYVV